MPGSHPGIIAERSGSGICRSVQYAHDVGLLHDQEFLAVELDLGSRPFAEQHAVADLEVNRNELAAFVSPARAHRGDFALRRLFLGGVGNDDAALGLLFGVDTLDDNAIVQGTEFRFGHDASLMRFALQNYWRKRIGMRPSSAPRKAPKKANIVSNRAFGVLIAGWEYGLAPFLSSKGLKPFLRLR